MRMHILVTTAALALAALLPPLRATEASPSDTLKILVVAANTGKAIGGAEVRAHAVTPQGITSWSKTTDERGIAKLEAIEVKSLALRVSANGFVGMTKEPVVVADVKQPLRVALAPGVAFEGTVLDASGEPVHRARVKVHAGGVFKDQREARSNGEIFCETSTDEDGKFHVPGIPEDGIATVVVQARGFAQGRTAVRAEKGRVTPQPLEMRLAPGGRVRGRVVDPSGKVVMGATVFVIRDGLDALKKDPRPASPGSAAEQTYLGKGTTDRKGRFAIDGLTLGHAYLICAYADGFTRSEWIGPFSAQKAGQKLTVALALGEATSGK